MAASEQAHRFHDIPAELIPREPVEDAPLQHQEREAAPHDRFAPPVDNKQLLQCQVKHIVNNTLWGVDRAPRPKVASNGCKCYACITLVAAACPPTTDIHEIADMWMD